MTATSTTMTATGAKPFSCHRLKREPWTARSVVAVSDEVEAGAEVMSDHPLEHVFARGPGTRAGLELSGEAAVLHGQDTMTHGDALLEGVGDQQHCKTACGHVTDKGVHVRLRADVQTTGRCVQDQQAEVRVDEPFR